MYLWEKIVLKRRKRVGKVLSERVDMYMGVVRARGGVTMAGSVDMRKQMTQRK